MNSSRHQHFVTTQWSLVVQAGQRALPEADGALETLCRAYWFPLYAFARRRGYSRDDAAEHTQEFFSRVIEKSLLETADAERGRFRTFLLTLFQRFLASELERTQAQKRGGLRTHFNIDTEDGELRYARSLTDEETPERIFERQWAMTVLNRVIEQLQHEYSVKGKAELFEHARQFLAGTAGGSYESAAQTLKMSEGALRVAVHRLRDRYRELLRQEIAGTLVDEKAVDDELNILRRAIQSENS